jgi:hypothetical protein
MCVYVTIHELRVLQAGHTTTWRGTSSGRNEQRWRDKGKGRVMVKRVRTRGVVKGREDNEAETEAAREEVLRILVLVLQEERKDGDKAQ